MPFESKAQQGYMFVHHPEIAKRWAKETSKEQFKSMPLRKKKQGMNAMVDKAIGKYGK